MGGVGQRVKEGGMGYGAVWGITVSMGTIWPAAYQAAGGVSGGGKVMLKHREWTPKELIVVLCCLLVVLGFWISWRQLSHPRDYGSGRMRCQSNLYQLARAVVMYKDTLGRNQFFPMPAKQFRGDEWLLSLYWCGILHERRVFTCPNTVDDFTLLPKRPEVWGLATNIPDNAMSYAGRCHGLTGRFAHRNTPGDFTANRFSANSYLACDKPDNHRGGSLRGGKVWVAFFDARVEAIEVPETAGSNFFRSQGYGQLWYMDPGEE
jgi:hypothetical protein